MATTLLQQPQHAFGQLNNHYHPGVFTPYTGIHGNESRMFSQLRFAGQDTVHASSGSEVSSTNSTGQQIPYTSPPRWTAQQALQRRTSKSPNIQDRTPIRHNRTDMSRHRSTSRPEVLMAYAQEQARQVHQDASRNLYMPSIDATATPYQPHPYNFPPSTSPYMHQQAYFDPTSAHAPYVQVPPQPSPAMAPSIYAPGRNEVQLPQVPANSLLSNETLYNQARAPQLPAMAPVPSNFPPIPQPLESTPNEVDVVGSRQKPQCWDHGCNGRQFSTFSNLLRHQREKSGHAQKARCPHCGTEFTRTTARNGHLYGGKCKGMPEGNKDDSKSELPEKDDEP